MGSFETSDRNSSEYHRPIRLPVRRENIWDALKDMVDDMQGWEVVSMDADRRVAVVRKPGGMMSGTATMTITVEGLEDVPSTTVSARCETEGGLMGRDKANVAEFIKVFHRRIC
jgi:hypothetical protein